jgi:LuxR family maltose regulon positive regulatory protein
LDLGGQVPMDAPMESCVPLPLPPLPPRHVPRPRLTSVLTNAVDLPLVLISAGAGTGKTVLLSEWAQCGGVSVAWFAPRPEDNDPRRFWRQLRSALHASGVLADDDSATSTPSDSARESVAALLRDIRPPPTTTLALIIDDAHVLTHPDILAGLDSIIQAGHPRLHMILAARSDPMLPLHRYRLAGQMFERRAVDLAMTEPEARAMLAAHGVTLPQDAFDVLMSRTEGWTGGMRLSAMRMESTEHPADFVAEFAVDQGSIGEYLMYEVLDRLPEPERRMLVQTAFLDVVTGDLADAITGLSGSAEALARLARTNSFVIPLDAAHTRFRYHHLLAEILRYLLRRQGLSVRQTLFRRAATWFEAHGELQDTFHWAASARDDTHAVSLLARGVMAEVFVRGDKLAQSELLNLPLPAQAGIDEGRTAEISIAQSAIVALTANSDSAARDLWRVEQDTLTLAPDDSDLRVNRELSILILGQKAGDAHAVDLAAQRLIAIENSPAREQVHGLRACVLTARAQAQFWDGRPDEVEPQLREALALAERGGLRSVQLETLSMLALVNSYWYRKVSADDSVHRARELIRSSASLSAPTTLELADAQRAFVAADLQAMAGAIGRALAVAPIDNDPALATLVAETRAQMLLECGQISAAQAVVEAAPSLQRGTEMLHAHRDMLLATIETSLGRPRRALRLLRRYQGGAFSGPSALIAAKAHLALDDLRSAEDCVRLVVAGPGTQFGRWTLVDALLCNAQIAQLRDDSGRALEMLSRALEIADGDFVMPFARMTDVFAALLASHPNIATRWPVAPGGADNRIAIEPESRRTPSLIEPLTEREQAVLRFLTTTMSTAEIADELYLSVNTIKTHLAAIYRKLAASKRREAVLRARELELL